MHKILKSLLAEAQGFSSRGQINQTISLLEKATQLAPSVPEAWLLLGNAYNQAGEHARAVPAFKNCLMLGEKSAEVYHNLGCAHYRLGEYESSLQNLERAAGLTTQISPWTAMATMIPGHPTVEPGRILDFRKAFAKRLADQNPGFFLAPRHGSRSDRLRVGFLSAHYNQSNYMKPVWGLINSLDRKQFEIHLLSDAAIREISDLHHLHRLQFHDLIGMDNADLGALIQDLGLDVLVDLNAYSYPDRLALFAKPSGLPTFAWFNMYATSGLSGMDFIIGDEWVVPGNEEEAFTEQVVRLPLSYLTFSVGYRVPPVSSPPCLANGYITFGCLAPLYKITDSFILTWKRISQGARHARLVLANTAFQSTHNRAHLAGRLSEAGIDIHRIDFLGPADHYNFLRYYGRIDVALDSFPYNGGTTTMEALWQGVPVLTFPGDRWAARIGTSLLSNTHLGDFIRPSLSDYVNTAIDLAVDPATPSRLESIRKSMRRRLSHAPVCDTSRLASSFQQALFKGVRAGKR